MDCYSTWCAPCVAMFKEVFPRKELGDFFNDKFICVKLQLNKTDQDDEYVRMWYRDVEQITTACPIPSNPTFLYFSPEGELVHRVPGSQDGVGLVANSTDAMNPEKQYYTLLKRFGQSEAKTPAMMKQLAEMSQQVMEKENALRFAEMYIGMQPDILAPDNLRFVMRFAAGSKEPGFRVLLQHPEKIDALFGEGKANEIVRSVIFNEEVIPFLGNAGARRPTGSRCRTGWLRSIRNMLSRWFGNTARSII